MARAQVLAPFERALALCGFAPMAAIDPIVLADIACQAQERRFAKGDSILKAGESLDVLHMLVEGRALVTGHEHDGEVLAAPTPLAPLSFFGRIGKEAEAKALDDVLTVSVDRRSIDEALIEDPSVMRALVAYLAQESIETLRASLPGAHLAPVPEPSMAGETDLGWISRLRTVGAAGLFRNGSIEAFMAIARILEPIHLPAGSALWKLGEPAEHSVLVRSGKLRGSGEKGLEFSVGAGFHAGLLECLCDQPRWYEARAETRVAGFRFPPRQALDLMEGHPEMTLEFVSLLARRVLEPTMWQRPGQRSVWGPE